jgi:hypothetical protein
MAPPKMTGLLCEAATSHVQHKMEVLEGMKSGVATATDPSTGQ